MLCVIKRNGRSNFISMYLSIDASSITLGLGKILWLIPGIEMVLECYVSTELSRGAYGKVSHSRLYDERIVKERVVFRALKSEIKSAIVSRPG